MSRQGALPPRSAPVYPVGLDLNGRPCLVVGGGEVAARKVRGLLACGAQVTVVAPELTAALGRLQGSARTTVQGRAEETREQGKGEPPDAASLALERRPYRRGEAAGYRLVVTATGRREVDGAVADDAEAAGVFVNSADDPEHCSFILPAVHRAGPVSVAVSTGGESPALAAWLRDRLAGEVGPPVVTMAAMLAQARRRLRADGRSTASVGWRRLLEGPFPGLVAQGQVEAARALLDEAVAGALRGGRT